MRPVSPDIGFPEHIVAENQLEYLPLPVAAVQTAVGTQVLVTRWTFTPEERAAIAHGADVYVSQLNFYGPMTPIMVGLEPPYTLKLET